MTRIVLGGIAAALIFWWLVPAVHWPAEAAHADKKADDAIPVSVARAARADIPIYLHGLGTVQAFNSVLVRSRVDGPIVRVDFAEGQAVRAGDLLVEIDPSTFEAQLAQSSALEAKDRAQLADAQLDLSRFERLMAANAISAQQRDTASALVSELSASVQADRAQEETAKLQLQFSHIRSPIDGRAGKRLIDIGNIVHASDQGGIVVVNQIHPIFVTLTLPSAALFELRDATKKSAIAVIASDRDGHRIAEGRLSLIDNQIDTTTATVTLKAVFTNADETLWPGQFVDVDVLVRQARSALTIPLTAVQYDNDGPFVFVVGKDARAVKRRIAVAFANKAVVIPETGIAAGECVVTDGQYRIEDGSDVRAVPVDAESACGRLR